MRARAFLLAITVVATAAGTLVVGPGTAVAQDERPSVEPATTSPTVSPSPGGRAGERSRAPGFVVLLVLLGLGLLWQVQRARRTTDRISARSLDELERATRPADRPPPPDGGFGPPPEGK